MPISDDIHWSPRVAGREARWAALGQSGVTVWFTGLPGSGKSTLAAAVEQELLRRGVPSFVLDGDDLRGRLNRDLGFSPADRNENVRRVGEVARLFAEAGMVAIASLISPYADGRRRARAMHEELGLRFVEVHVDAPLEECERRDPKGLYAKARAGQISGMTGVDGAYEAPENAELRVRTDRLSVMESVEAVLAVISDLPGSRSELSEPATVTETG